MQQTKAQNKKPSLLSHRFWVRELYAAAEGSGAALLYSALTGLLAFLFSTTHAIGGAYPFAIAYLAAADRRLPFALLGAALGALSLGVRGFFYIGAYLLLILLRLLLSAPREEGRILPASREFFEEQPPLRAAVACVVGTALSLYELLVGGLTNASLLFSVVMILSPTLLCVLYVGFFESGRSPYELLVAPHAEGEATRADYALSLGVAAILFSVLLGLRSVSPFGISVSMVLAAVFSFLLPQKWGLVRGGAAALLIACGTTELAYLPAYAVMLLPAALSDKIGVLYTLAAAAIGGTLTAYAVTGADAWIGFFPETFIALALAWPLFRHLPRLSKMMEERARREGAALCEELGEEGSTRMQILSEAYLSLSEIFEGLSGLSSRPAEGEYKEACHAVFLRHCEGCAGAEGCWERGDRSALRALDCLAEQYANGTPPHEIRLTESLIRSCGRREPITADVHEACAALEADKRTHERNGIFARNYRMVGEILLDAARKSTGERTEDFALGRAARRILLEEGVHARRVSVIGSRRRRLVAGGVSWDPDRVKRERLRVRLEEAFHVRLGEPIVEAREGEVRLRMDSTRRFGVRAARASAACGREVCGDAFTTFEGEGDYYYALLSDGMGSGKEAAITAGICGTFLEKTLSAGTEKSTALKALNTLLCEREGECSATVDLLEIDLLDGSACFVKSGAAASYVRRGESLFRIRAGTVPVGILGALDAERIRFDVQVGDVIVMLSDGISQSEEDSAWLCELLSGEWTGGSTAMAESIVEGARRHTDRRDDMTVALLEITDIPA